MTDADIHSTRLSGLEPLMSIDEVAEVLRISSSGVYRLVRSGDLARVKVGGRTLFEPGDVREFIAGCRDMNGPKPRSHASNTIAEAGYRA